jgi:hypothetical protein
MTRAEIVAEAKALGIKYLPQKSVAQLTAEIAHVKGGGAPYKGKPDKGSTPAAPAKAQTPKLPSPAPPMPDMDEVKKMICYTLNKIIPDLEAKSSYNPLIGGSHKGVLRLGCTIQKKHVPPTLKAPYGIDQDPQSVYWEMPSSGDNAWADFTIYFDSNGDGRFLLQAHNLEKNKPSISKLIKYACSATKAKKDLNKIKKN